MFIICLLNLFLLVPALNAHDLWWKSGERGLTLFYGHQYSSHPGANILLYDLTQVKPVICLNARGISLLEIDPVNKNSIPATPPQMSSPLKIEHHCSLAFAQLASYWTKTPRGTQNVSKNHADAPLQSWLSKENVKGIWSWSPQFSAPISEEFEVIPLENPLALTEGSKLHLRVTWQKKPVKGAVVANEGTPRGDTDDEGLVNLKLRHQGVQRLEATWHQPLNSPLADEAIHTSSLIFELKEGK